MMYITDVPGGRIYDRVFVFKVKWCEIINRETHISELASPGVESGSRI